MRLHREGDHPADAARNAQSVLEFLSVAVSEGNPGVDILAGGGRGGLGLILMALEDTVDYVGRSCAELAAGNTGGR